MMRPEFQVHLLNAEGIARATRLAEEFSAFLETIEVYVPSGRERALVITKLQEAAFFAKRAIAMHPANQAG